jgi:hypothetical protein
MADYLQFNMTPVNEQLSDRWQYLGNESLRYQIYSAYFDDRLEVIGKFQKKNFEVLKKQNFDNFNRKLQTR